MIPDQSCLVYTPKVLADALVAAIRSDDSGRGEHWLEPCVGKGALLAALARSGIPRRHVVGLDLARRAERLDTLAKVRRGVDFLGWAKRTTLRFDRVVANPPYLAIERLQPDLRSQALTTFVPTNGKYVPPGANCWYAFLCASVSLLRPGGALAFVLPAAWQYADYARPLRDRLHELFSRVSVCRSETPLFSGVQEGSVVLIARDYGRGKSKGIAQRIYTRQANFIRAVARGGPSRPCVQRRVPSTAASPLFSSVATVSIGAVTGDSRYFLLSEEQRLERRLPREASLRVLTRAAHLTGPEVVEGDWHRLQKRGERVWLFRPPNRLLKHTRVAAYLALAQEDGGCDRSRWQVRRRAPDWHRVVLPKHPDGFITGMSSRGLWVALNRSQDITATNTLYTIAFKERSSIEAKAAWCLMLFCDDVQLQIRDVTRQYADGLSKLEPRDINRLRVPQPRRLVGALAAYREAAQSLLAGDTSRAASLANRLR